MRPCSSADHDGGGQSLISPDGAWWWSGDRWVSTLSPDGTWQWNGDAWVPIHNPRTVPSWVIRDGLIWLAIFVMWVPVVSVLAFNEAGTRLFVGVAVPIGAIALLATMIYGGLLGRHRLWREMGLASLAGTGSLVVCYSILMAVAPDPGTTNDTAAGAGAAILAVPTLIVVGTLLASGGAVGRWTRRAGTGQGAAR